MDERVAGLLRAQDGVVARFQLRAAGLERHDVERLFRRRTLTTIHPGVYVDHTGRPSWTQQAWAAVLHGWPAALSHGSALRAAEGPGSRHVGVPVEISVDRRRRLVAPAGVRVHRVAGLDDRVRWNLSPPRIRYEEAVLTVAAASRSDLEAVAVVAAACSSRRTTPARLLDELARHPRLPRRRWLASVLADVAAGACSTLEHGYLHRVERAHGLTGARRQRRERVAGRVVYRDVEYAGGLIIELDGRLFHEDTAQRDRDLDRDLAAAAGGRRTVRLSWGQVFDRPCRTALLVGRLLALHGWPGAALPCGAGCALRSDCGLPRGDVG